MKLRMKDFLVTAGILVVSFLFSLITNSIFQTDASVPMVFVLGVFLISVITKGYLCGILASLLSTLAVNFAFTFPYFEFNFTIPENLFSAVVMMVVAVVTGARTTDDDKVTALDLGANDYVTKPFSTAELLARVRSALRNRRYDDQDGVMGDTFDVADLHLDFARRQITLAGREVRLTQTEYNIVTVLAHHAGRVMTYAAIIRAVWGSTDEGSVKKLQVNMANIRKKLGERPGERRYISNELGVGYRMISDDE